jgi:hypothetical protein
MNDPLRTLARSAEYQNLYSRAKELNINLFNNITDFSIIQLRFLQYLELYYNLYNNVDSEEKLMDNERIKKDILVDAYLIYKSKNRKDKKKNRRKKEFNTKGEKTNNLSQVVFKKKRKS